MRISPAEILTPIAGLSDILNRTPERKSQNEFKAYLALSSPDLRVSLLALAIAGGVALLSIMYFRAYLDLGAGEALQ